MPIEPMLPQNAAIPIVDPTDRAGITSVGSANTLVENP